MKTYSFELGFFADPDTIKRAETLLDAMKKANRAANVYFANEMKKLEPDPDGSKKYEALLAASGKATQTYTAFITEQRARESMNTNSDKWQKYIAKESNYDPNVKENDTDSEIPERHVANNNFRIVEIEMEAETGPERIFDANDEQHVKKLAVPSNYANSSTYSPKLHSHKIEANVTSEGKDLSPAPSGYLPGNIMNFRSHG